MKFCVITIFPEIFAALKAGVLGKAIDEGKIECLCINPRDFTSDRHKTVDDEPYGGGSGMVMKPEPLVAAIKSARERLAGTRVILLTPKGKPFNQKRAKELARLPSITLVCGRYEGIDERVRAFVDDELSVGDFVLSGGEFAALCVLDAVARLVPGVLGCSGSLCQESFEEGLLEYPQYTRPREFEGLKVPEVLTSGNHAAIKRWRRLMSLKETFERRPDLLAEAELSEKDRELLEIVLRGRGV